MVEGFFVRNSLMRIRQPLAAEARCCPDSRPPNRDPAATMRRRCFLGSSEQPIRLLRRVDGTDSPTRLAVERSPSLARCSVAAERRPRRAARAGHADCELPKCRGLQAAGRLTCESEAATGRPAAALAGALLAESDVDSQPVPRRAPVRVGPADGHVNHAEAHPSTLSSSAYLSS